MLEPAYLHKKILQNEYAKVIIKSENFYYFLGPYYNYELNIDKDSWNNLQFVSISKNKKNEYLIHGYFCANINRDTDCIDNIQLLKFKNFKQDNTFTFSYDLINFLKNLFEKYQFRKIEWCVIIGNPAEKMYDRIITKWGGKIIGIFREKIKLLDGKFYDLKYYEIFKNEYDKQKRITETNI